jgi:hypothetical protein
MKLQVLAGALALGLGASALAPVAARADDRSRSYRSYRSGSYHSGSYHSGSYHSYRPYRYSGYAYRPAYRGNRYYGAPYYPAYAYGGYYGSSVPYGYPPRVVAYPSYGYGGYRPLVSVSVGGPHFGVWLGF